MHVEKSEMKTWKKEKEIRTFMAIDGAEVSKEDISTVKGDDKNL